MFARTVYPVSGRVLLLSVTETALFHVCSLQFFLQKSASLSAFDVLSGRTALDVESLVYKFINNYPCYDRYGFNRFLRGYSLCFLPKIYF